MKTIWGNEMQRDIQKLADMIRLKDAAYEKLDLVVKERNAEIEQRKADQKKLARLCVLGPLVVNLIWLIVLLATRR